MTICEFDTTPFRSKMKVEYKGEIRLIGSVCFTEKLIGLVDVNNPKEDYDWVRCENCTIIP